MRSNKIKQIWRDGKTGTMGWLLLSHTFTAEMMARQGFDCLAIDLQHGTSEMSDVLPILQAISQTDTVPIVRVGWNDPAAIMKALDLGAYGIIVPLINNSEEAKELKVPQRLKNHLPQIGDFVQNRWCALARDFLADIKGQDHQPYLTFRDGWHYQLAIESIRKGHGWLELPGDDQ